MRSVSRLAWRLRQRFSEEMSGQKWAIDAGLRPPCYGTLQVIARRGPVSQREASDVLGIDPGDLVGVIDILEQAGYVRRDRDPDDRRRYALSLTAGGRRALARLDAVATRVADEVLAPLDPSERTVLLRLIAKATDPAGSRAAT